MKLNDLIINLKNSNTESKKRGYSLQRSNKSIDINTILRNSFIDKDNELVNLNKSLKKSPKIIGITGSRGKSTVAYLTHQYLKSKGYKSILYSSLLIDSPLSFISNDEAVENPLRDEKMLLDALTDAVEYEADYLILEVNERAIHNGLTKDIPFDIRMITNLYPKHNVILYPNYVEIKKEFLKEVNDPDVEFIIGTSDASYFTDLIAINPNNPRKTYSSRWVSNVKEINVDYKYYSKTSIDKMSGLDFTIINEKIEYDINSRLLFPFNAENITGCIALLNSLCVFDYDFFKSFILKMEIPGRDVYFKVGNKHVIVSLHASPHLETLKKYKDLNYIKKVKVVSGETGLGYYFWDKEHLEEKLIADKADTISFNMHYINDNADYTYLTVSDSGATNKDELLDYQSSLLSIPHFKIMNRQQAIKQAINELQENEVLFIYGRGNRRILCDGYDTVILHHDIEIVRELFKQTEGTNE